MPLRVMTYNVREGGAGRERLLLEVLGQAAADVVVLQEVRDAEFVGRLGDALGMQCFFARGNARYHLALLSRWPIVERRSHRPFPPIRNAVLEATIEHPSGQRVAVFGVHPVPFPSIVLELWRRWEITVVLRRVRRHASALCLVVGDFNAIAPGDEPAVDRLGVLVRTMILLQGRRIFRFAIQAMLKAGMADCFRERHPDADGFTFGPPAPNGRIDYIFANAAMKALLRDCFVVRHPPAVDVASDHYPVVADFAV